MLQITNFELGVLFPLRSEEELERVACWERPPRKYGSGDVPWVSADGFVAAVYIVLICRGIDTR